MKKEISKKIMIINFCLAAILALVAGSFAAYTSLSSAKRVVSTTATNQLFSSNVLYTYDGKISSLSTRSMSFSTDSEENVFQFTVCNYAQGDKTTHATRDITYDLTVELLDLDGKEVTDTKVLSEYKLDGTAFGTSKVTKQGTLSSSKVSEDSYKITIPAVYMKNYKIRITAESNISNYLPIGRMISVTETTVSTHWTGTFVDGIVDSTAHTPSELGSINVRISGQENETMVITWDTNYVEIDPWFLEDIGSKNYTITVGKDGLKTMEFEVGGENQPNQYHISFYRTRSAKTFEETWDEMKGHIKFESKTIEETTTAGGDSSEE